MVRRGFKNTEIGEIPEDWEVKELGIISDKVMVGIASAATHAYTDKGVVMFRNQNIKPNYLNVIDILYIKNEYELLFKNKRLVAGDLLTARTGYPGTTCIVPAEFEGAQSFTTLITRLKANNNSLFISQYMNSEFGETFFETNQIGGGQKNVNSSILKKMPIPLPPLPEQKVIAEALSDTDAWIENLEKLIAKKRLIKQGAMQQLLTPKEGWEVKKLGEVGRIFGGLSGKTKADFGFGNAYYIPFMNVMKNVVIDKHFTEKFNLKNGESQNRVYKNDLLFNGSSETPEELGISSVVLDDIENLYLNSFCFGFRIFDINVYPLFLSYLMRSPYGRQVIFYLAQGATRYNLSKANFFNLEIAFPKNFAEQTRIATILSDMDTELEGLENTLGKARQIKQGMMQELLTGRVRLV